MNHQLRLVSFSFVLSLIFAFPANAAPLELDELRQQHHKAVVAPHETARTELDEKFGAALGNAEAAAKQGGRLDEVVAIQADRKRLAEKIPFPENDESTPASVARLRTIYREQLAQLDVKRATAEAEILPAYTAKLQELEANLTKADRIADALAVKAYREGLGKETAPVVASTLPAVPVPPTPPAPMPTAALSAKGDDRKAAEWVLSVGGTIEIWEGKDRSIPIRNLGDLPSEKFSIRKIFLDNNKGSLKPVSDADFQILAGLEGLETVIYSKLAITPAALDVFRTCPSINELAGQYNRLGDELWEHLAGLKLWSMSQGYDELPTTGVGISQLDHAALVRLFLASTDTGDAAMGEIAQFPNLAILGLSDTKVTDTGIASLAPLKKLTNLNVFGTDVTAKGLGALKGAPIINLGYGRNMNDFITQLPEVAKLFPDLIEIHLPRDVNPTTEDWNAISTALPKLERIEVRSRKFGDDTCEGMARLPELANISLYDAALTDVGIGKLASAKKLRRIEMPLAKITDLSLETLAGMRSIKNLVLPKPGNGLTTAGLEKLKRERPDISIR